MFQTYKFGFDVWGLLLFLIIMIPNFIWFKFPAQNDILRRVSSTPNIDYIVSICQVLMVLALCIVINFKHKQLNVTPLMLIVIVCCVLYYISWFIYYVWTVNVFVIIALTILPCFSFLLFSIERKNSIAIIFIIMFTVCHLASSLVNFVFKKI